MERTQETYEDVGGPSQRLIPVSPAHRKLWARRRKAMEASGCRHSPIGVKPAGANAAFENALSLFEVLLKSCGLYQVGHVIARDIRVRQIDLQFDNLPERFDGYTILHLTDLHIDKFEGLDDAIISAVAGADVDLCVMTGDFRAADDGPHEQIMPPMGQLVAAIQPQDGFYAVLGNHDDHQLGLAIEQQLGIRLLANESDIIRRGNSQIRLIGADDVNRFYTADADRVLSGGHEDFTIALVHSPEMATEAADGGCDLYLSGHTHGGQVCLPGGKPLVTHLNVNQHLASGQWRVGKMQGYTSSGAGVSGPPVRFFSRGEVTFFRLTRRARI